MCTEAQANEMIRLLSDSSIHQSSHNLLAEISRDLKNLVDHAREEAVTWQPNISSAHPLMIDKHDRLHLYIFSATPFELFASDVAGLSGSTLLAPFTIAAGKFIELPFRTGDKMVAPAIANNAEVVVLMLAQNEVLAV
jgi:hypothetical protein